MFSRCSQDDCRIFSGWSFKDLKELNDPQLFDDPSYSMINWKYGLWQSKSLRWYRHHWWSCLITDDVGCIEVGELFVRRRLHWSKKPSSNTQSHLCVLQKPRYMKILLRKSQPKNIHIKHMNSVETYSSSLQLHEWTTLSPFIPRGNVSITELMVKYATSLKTSLDDQ